ncbi:hypothetical protein HGO97_021850 [Faecalicatena sp. AGMB00832]|uniref:Uncharacterized protein n=1 Tax=Faecalicatena faecalis TaxID=2726362 RepID=A0ABS6D9Z3_9FIRM|nr:MULTISPECIES: hypothetical protein [Faecalicatena]MBU3878449.1 hypothetical protein [Faecalicatena faecalis]MCI6465578.1 hypothetical protein [Faecalicatena sp.]MDY5617410.1 hypothetical protein [Lachnospiraceae bacterium]
MLKNIVLAVALVCSCIYLVLFFVNNPKLNVISNKIQKPFMAVSFLLLVVYMIL